MKSLIASENLPLFSGSHEISCHVCNGKGVLICCDYCPYAYHPSCLQPPMVQRPFDYWVCPACIQDIKSQHKSDIKLRCEKHKDTILSVSPLFQSTSPPSVTIQSFVPTRISSARFPPSSFSLSPFLSKLQSRNQSHSHSHSHSLSQSQSQSQSQSHSPLLLLLLLLLFILEVESITRNEQHSPAIFVECTTAVQSGTLRSRFEGRKSCACSQRIMSSIWALLIQSGKLPNAMTEQLKSIMESEPCSISLGETPLRRSFRKIHLALI